jgi:hypothetical protein
MFARNISENSNVFIFLFILLFYIYTHIFYTYILHIYFIHILFSEAIQKKCFVYKYLKSTFIKMNTIYECSDFRAVF